MKNIKFHISNNSWGTNWGNNGHAWLPYDYITGGYMHTAWVGVDLEDPISGGYLDLEGLAKAVEEAKNA